MSPLWKSRSRRPTARTAELLVEELGDELLVYDQRTDQVHCLGSAARKVWRACDGKTSVEQLGSTLDLGSEFVNQALDELEACGLFDGDAAADGVTRREATARLARMGAAAAAGPLIYSIAAPSPALAATLRFCQTTNFACAGAPSIKGGACGLCFGEGCACCYTSPNQCNSKSGHSVSYTRCTGVSSGNHCDVCTLSYITAGAGLCAPAITNCPSAICLTH